MIRLISLVLCLVIVLQSCKTIDNVTHHDVTPTYISEDAVKRQLISANELPLPTDTTKTIIVYNVVEREHKKKISDETIRSLITQFFGTVSTIFALYKIEEGQ